MALFDLPLAELETYCPALDEPADLDAFWGATLAQART
ncbi:MAG TPA: acetylxylan esterase, partial [Cellulomonas sp.]|nr:acetylxylan esterase [Cellulomonas sp.]